MNSRDDRAGLRYGDEINRVEFARGVLKPRVSAWTSEMTHIWAKSADQVRDAVRTLGDMPVIVLLKEPSLPAPNETAELREEKSRILRRQHEQTVALSKQGRLMVVEESGHYIQLDQPSAVIDAIIEVVHAQSSATSADSL